MRKLTPTQKAVGTNTYFIRTTIWFPDGSRIQMELPWVQRNLGDQLLEQYKHLINHPEYQSAEKWEEQARRGWERYVEMRPLVRAFKLLPVVSDSDWVQQPSSRPQRGIIDSAREIVFSRPLTDREFEQTKVYLAKEAFGRGIGWTGVGGYQLETHEPQKHGYRFTTTWDSSD